MATTPNNLTRSDATLSEPPASQAERLPDRPTPLLGHYIIRSCAGNGALVDVQARFVQEGVRRGEAVVAVVAVEHAQAIERQLTAERMDCTALRSTGRLVIVDAEWLLGEARRDGTLNWSAFRQAMCGALKQAAPGLHVRALSDLASVLSTRGEMAAALRIEEMWCELQAAQVVPLTVLCAFDVTLFGEHPDHLKRLRSMYAGILGVRGGESKTPAAGTPITDLNAGEPRDTGEQPGEAPDDDGRQAPLSGANLIPSAARATGHSSNGNERLLRSVADSLPVLIAYVDRDERYRFVNAEYERWFGVPREAVLGRRVADLLGEAAYEQLQDPLALALRGSRVEVQVELDHPVAGARLTDVVYVPQLDLNGQVEGIAVLVSDTTARRRLELELQVAADRSKRLVTITAALAEAVEPRQVFDAVDQVSAAVNASSVGLFRLRGDGKHVDLLHDLGYPAQARDTLTPLSLDTSRSFPALDSIRTRQPMWFESQQELLDSYPHLKPMVTAGRDYQAASLPVMAHDRVWGALALTFDNQPVLDDQQRDFLLLVARYCGQALERLRLLEAERSARASAEAAAARADLLSEASRALSAAGPIMSEVLQAFVQRATVSYAELCALSLASEESLELVSLHHRDPEAEVALREVVLRSAPRLNDAVSGRVVTTGRSLLVEEVDRAAMLAQARPDLLPWLERWMPRSFIVAPLRSRGRVIGTIGVARGEHAEPFTPEDVRLLEDLGERAGMAIDNSRLYEDSVNARLQTEHLYALAGIVIAARDIQEVYGAALDALERTISTPRAAILTFDERGVMRFRASRGLSQQYCRAVEGHSPWTRDETDPKPIFVADAINDPTMTDFAPLFKREHIGAIGFIPLIASNMLVGKFMVYYDAPHALMPHELAMAQAIANHVAAAVARFSAMNDLQRTVRFNEMFTGMLGHDLRNPLWAIITGAELAMAHSKAEQSTKALTRIIRSGHRMARMIDQLLDFTRVRVGSGIPIQPERLDLVPLVQQVLDELAAASPGCTLVLDRAGDTIGHWDADRLSQVFSNLVGNAVQHGTGQRVQLRLDGTDPEHVHAAVHNDGTIPEDAQPTLFEPMGSSDRRRRQSDGLGLGLYISQQIVQAHGGHIRVVSDAANGTRLTVSLPRVPGTRGMT